MLLGYYTTSKPCWSYDLRLKKVVESTNVWVDEKWRQFALKPEIELEKVLIALTKDRKALEVSDESEEEENENEQTPRPFPKCIQKDQFIADKDKGVQARRRLLR